MGGLYEANRQLGLFGKKILPSRHPADLYDILDDEEEYELDLWDEDMDDEDIESDDDY